MNSLNKDSRTNKKRKIFEIAINEDYCKGCNICVDFCPKKLFECSDKINSRGYYQPAIKQSELCTGCKFCELLCPELAIVISE